MSSPTQLVYAIIKFLDEQSKTTSEETAESLEVARQCLETAYGVSLSDDAKYSLPAPLEQIFSRGLEQFPKKVQVPKLSQVNEVSKAQAEKYKTDGNDCMRAEKFDEALQHYTKAVEADPTNAVYFCNRAAAFSKLDKNQEALDDCIQALQIDPGYSKAFGRKGLAHSALGQHGEAVECYKKALELDPGNSSYQQNLDIADQKIKESGVRPAGPGAPGNMDFTSMFSNPALMNMATSMMSNPEMQQMMSGLMSGAQQEPSGGEGFAGLLQAGQRLAQQMQQTNPDLVNQLRTQMNRPGDGPNGTE